MKTLFVLPVYNTNRVVLLASNIVWTPCVDTSCQVTDFHTFSSQLALFQDTSAMPAGGFSQRIKYPTRQSSTRGWSTSSIIPKSQRTLA
jgi:hypothetical protein